MGNTHNHPKNPNSHTTSLKKSSETVNNAGMSRTASGADIQDRSTQFEPVEKLSRVCFHVTIQSKFLYIKKKSSFVFQILQKKSEQDFGISGVTCEAFTVGCLRKLIQKH
jgi:hypothetical protein